MRNTMLHHRAGVSTIVLVTWVLVAGAQADRAPAAVRTSVTSTRVLHFPQDQYMGSLYVEDPCLGSTYMELGRDLSLPYGLDPRRLALGGDWDFVGLAQGETAVPAGRNVQLIVTLRPRKEDVGRLAALPPRQYQMFAIDRCREDPLDLSGLSTLEPNDLYCLTVSSLIARAEADQCILKAIRHLTGLKVMKLHGTGVTDKGMEYLRELRSLRAFEFYSEAAIGNQGLGVLKDLPNLEYLDLGTGATDEGFKHLGQFPNLRWLRIRTGRIWGPGLAELANLPRLERLCLWGNSPLSDRHLQYLEGLTRLKSLTLWGEAAERLTDASLASIGKLRDLEELHFIGWSAPAGFTPKGVASLKNLKNLKKVDFGLAWAGPQGAEHGDEIARLLADMPNLESIKGISYLSADGMKTLDTLRNLKCLHLALKDRHQGYYGPTGLTHLAQLSKLEELTFTGGRFLSDADLDLFESMSSLRDLSVNYGNFTDRGLVSLGKLRQLEHLSVSADNPITKRGLNELSGLTNLQTLRVHDNHIWLHPDAKAEIDESRLNLAGLKSLKTLDLAGFTLEADDLACLSGLHHLEVLYLQNNALPETALRNLKDLPALKHLDVSQINCSDGSGLACLAGLPGLRDLTLRGRITDSALGRLAGVTSAWSISAWTNEPLQPQTVTYLKQNLPDLEYIHLYPLPEFEKPKVKSSLGQQGQIRAGPSRNSRPAPRRPPRQR
jgi:Leucine-rich repeat (LRR) protein